jgi:hypothetical protein
VTDFEERLRKLEDEEEVESDSNEIGSPEVKEEESMTLILPRRVLESAVLDALRLDYEGRLAKICESAIEDNATRLREFVGKVIVGVVDDEEFASSLREMVRKRIRDRVFAKVDTHVKKSNFASMIETPALNGEDQDG